MYTAETPDAPLNTRICAVSLLLLLPPPPHPIEKTTPKNNAKSPTRPPTELLRCKQLVYQKTGNSGNWMRGWSDIDVPSLMFRSPLIHFCHSERSRLARG